VGDASAAGTFLSAAQPRPKDSGEINAFVPSLALRRAALSRFCGTDLMGHLVMSNDSHMLVRVPAEQNPSDEVVSETAVQDGREGRVERGWRRLVGSNLRFPRVVWCDWAVFGAGGANRGTDTILFATAPTIHLGYIFLPGLPAFGVTKMLLRKTEILFPVVIGDVVFS